MFLVKMFRPRPRTSNELRRILVVSTTALGDTLWATPSIENLRKKFPDAQISVLTSPIGKQALLHHPQIDSIYLLEEPLLKNFFRLLRPLRKELFDAALVLHASQRLILPLLTLSGIPKILGTAEKNKGLDALLTTALPRHFEHEIERRARIVRELGAKTTVETLSYFVRPQETLQALEFLGEKKGPRIALHLGAREQYRRFPKSSYAALGKMLQRELQCELFLTGTKDEEELLLEVQKNLPEARIVIKPFRQFAALLSLMDLVISTDTGPLHLACALNRPLVALFASSEPQLFGPYKAPLAKTITHRTSCSPCLKRKCHEPFCYLQFSLSQILNEAKEALNPKTI